MSAAAPDTARCLPGSPIFATTMRLATTLFAATIVLFSFGQKQRLTNVQVGQQARRS